MTCVCVGPTAAHVRKLYTREMKIDVRPCSAQYEGRAVSRDRRYTRRRSRNSCASTKLDTCFLSLSPGYGVHLSLYSYVTHS
jgi:hypothetical protein